MTRTRQANPKEDLVRSQPDDFEAPYPAYNARPTAIDEYVITMLGVQAPPDGSGAPLLHELIGLMSRTKPHHPRLVEMSWHIDAEGFRNDILLPYWTTREEMEGFFARPDVAAWRSRVRSDDVGWWRESLVAPVSSLDGNYSIPQPQYGVSRYSEVETEQFHAYMGSMRDRTPDYLAGSRDGRADGLTPLPAPDSRHHHLVTSHLPDNLCFIRGAWGWMQAEEEEQKAFQDQMLPVLTEGSEYLRDNPEESSCISMRQTQALHVGYDNNVQVEALGWFLTLQDLERWTLSHPKHLAIMESIFDYMHRFDFKPKLNLGHEVAVVPEGSLHAEYNNCHPKTGFLPYFPSRVVEEAAEPGS